MTLKLDNVTSCQYVHKGKYLKYVPAVHALGLTCSKKCVDHPVDHYVNYVIMSKNVLCFVNESFDPLSNPLPLPLPPRLVCLCSGRTLPLGVYAYGPH